MRKNKINIKKGLLMCKVTVNETFLLSLWVLIKTFSMKLMYKGRHLKTIPKKFAEIPEIELYIEDEFNLRLNDIERKNLLRALFEHRTRKFVIKQRQNPLLDEYLGNSKLVDAVKVMTTHENYYAIRFEGGKLLKCPFEVYSASPFHGIIQKA